MAAMLLLVTFLWGDSSGASKSVVAADLENQPKYDLGTQAVVRAYYSSPAQLTRLAQMTDLRETEWNREESYVVLITTREERSLLLEAGLSIEIDEAQTVQLVQMQAELSGDDTIAPIGGYACYRTVEETYTTASDLVTNYPTLATWNDIGDSWDKANGNGGYDLMVLKLTNSNVPGPKPPMFVMSSVHAREYTPAELNTRFARVSTLQLRYRCGCDMDS